MSLRKGDDGVTALLVLIGLMAGLALGWYLRRINTWCPTCGDTLVCAGCGRWPGVRRPSETSRAAQ